MTHEIRFTPDALSDMREHNSWYERKRLGLGVRFSDSVSEQVKLLIEAPELYRIYYRNIRRCSIRNFPYEIFYQLVDETVVILAVHGVRQDPEQIKSRLVSE